MVPYSRIQSDTGVMAGELILGKNRDPVNGSYHTVMAQNWSSNATKATKVINLSKGGSHQAAFKKPWKTCTPVRVRWAKINKLRTIGGKKKPASR